MRVVHSKGRDVYSKRRKSWCYLLTIAQLRYGWQNYLTFNWRSTQGANMRNRRGSALRLSCGPKHRANFAAKETGLRRYGCCTASRFRTGVLRQPLVFIQQLYGSRNSDVKLASVASIVIAAVKFPLPVTVKHVLIFNTLKILPRSWHCLTSVINLLLSEQL